MCRICYGNSRHHRQHIQFYWNSSNQIFDSFAFLTVSIGDLIDFICPYYENFSSNNHIEYNTLYLVHANDYYNCNTTNYNPLLICNKPYDNQRLIYTLSISKYLPYPNLPEFDDGQFYYFITTSSGKLTNLNQRSNGLCYTKNMKLIVNVKKSIRNFYEESRPIIAKRTNITFIEPYQRFLSFSSDSSITPSRSIALIFLLLVFCLLIKLKI